MTAQTQTDPVIAQIRQLTRRIMAEQAVAMEALHGTLTTVPLASVSNVIKFAVGTREFTLTVTLVEQTTPDGTPTPGYVR